jgi:hypothetical protein
MVYNINCRKQFWCVSQFVFTVYGGGDGSCLQISSCVLLFQSVDRPPDVYVVCRFYIHASMPHRRHTLCSTDDHTSDRIIISSAQALQPAIAPDHVAIVLLSVCYHIAFSLLWCCYQSDISVLSWCYPLSPAITSLSFCYHFASMIARSRYHPAIMIARSRYHSLSW